jgi:hypothetical protein
MLLDYEGLALVTRMRKPPRKAKNAEEKETPSGDQVGDAIM